MGGLRLGEHRMVAERTLSAEYFLSERLLMLVSPMDNRSTE